MCNSLEALTVTYDVTPPGRGASSTTALTGGKPYLGIGSAPTVTGDSGMGSRVRAGQARAQRRMAARPDPRRCAMTVRTNVKAGPRISRF